MEPKLIIKKHFNLKLKAVNEESYQISGVFSTADEDRHGEIIDQKGWDLKSYMENPVILFAHDHYTPAVGKMVNLFITAEGQLEGTLQFAVKEDTSGLAETLFNLYKGGYMRAFSVGFQNKLFEYNPETEEAILRQNELYEVSCVNVPANAAALAKSKGVDLGSLEKLDKETEIRQIEHVLSEESIKRLTDGICKELRRDNAEKVKAETPVRRGAFSARDINKAVRRLLKEKRKIIQ